MHSSKSIMPLQLLSIFTFILLFLPPVFPTGQVAKPGCKDWCGNLSIPYPFGVGSECSLDPSFTLSCNTSTDPPRPYLTVIDKEVIDINETYIRVKYPNLVSVCYDLSGESYKSSSMIINLSGTPYTLSGSNTLTAIGCDDMVLGFQQSDGTHVRGGCSAVCSDENDTSGIGYCPNNYTSLNNGCCQAPISAGIDFLGAQLVDLSAELLRRKRFPCSYAFVRDQVENETVFSYPLLYLDNTTAFLNDNWASTTRPPVVRLKWMIIGADNCSQAYLNSATYACKDNRSVCDDFEYPDAGRGYQCRCLPGYEGNPYLSGGCNSISVSRSLAKSGCPDRCGELLIPFPFGVGPNCYLAPSFEITCNTSDPIPYLSVFNAEIVELLNSSQVVVYDTTQPGLTCYNLSDQRRRMSKTAEHSLIMNLTNTQYTLSDENRITAIGCDDILVGTFGQTNQSYVCSTICSDNPFDHFVFYGYCSHEKYPGNGCCVTPIPRGTTYLEANLIGLGLQGPSMSLPCSYTFVRYLSGAETVRDVYPLSINAEEIMERNSRKLPRTKLALDWRIGAVNCKEAQQDRSSYACVDINSECVDFDATLGGYLCNCSKGYQGNPYLTSGCQDIDECGDTTTNPCNSNSICINTQGSFTCSCPKGYNGDGRKDGKGCIKKPQTKMITILTGVGSGLGFLVLLLVLFWLYKLFQKRKETIIRDKLFKRNGGLLLRRHTNDGALGRTKLFPSNELEIATDYFNRSRILGQGGQGTVYKGMLSDGKIVAVKKSKLVEENHLEQFINEVVILSQINHRNVVKLLGCCLETEVPILVYEFMPNGTLSNLIHDPNTEFPFPWYMRLKIASDIAGALAYLHSASSRPIYHRDIKSSNILLDEKYVVKVSDFGISRSVDVNKTHLTTMVKGTFGYFDPEYFQSSQFTEKSDVYSFGVILVELLTRLKPISSDETHEERGLAIRFLRSMEENYLDTILDHQVLEQGKKEDVILVAKLAKRCLHLKGKMRPTMKEVATELESVRISRLSLGPKDEFEEVREFEDLSTMISADNECTWSTTSYKSAIADNECTWSTTSYKSAIASSSDTQPLILSAE